MHHRTLRAPPWRITIPTCSRCSAPRRRMSPVRKPRSISSPATRTPRSSPPRPPATNCWSYGGRVCLCTSRTNSSSLTTSPAARGHAESGILIDAWGIPLFAKSRSPAAEGATPPMFRVRQVFDRTHIAPEDIPDYIAGMLSDAAHAQDPSACASPSRSTRAVWPISPMMIRCGNADFVKGAPLPFIVPAGGRHGATAEVSAPTRNLQRDRGRQVNCDPSRHWRSRRSASCRQHGHSSTKRDQADSIISNCVKHCVDSRTSSIMKMMTIESRFS